MKPINHGSVRTEYAPTKEKAAPGRTGTASKTALVNRNYSTTSGIDNLLAHLDKVKRTGPDTWQACCPAHADKSPSLRLRDNDGVILVHCFAGCSVHEVVSAVGMELSDLFPPREIQHGKPERRPFPAADVLRAIGFEALIVAASGASLLAGQPFTEADRERLILAVHRIQAGLKAAGVAHG